MKKTIFGLLGCCAIASAASAAILSPADALMRAMPETRSSMRKAPAATTYARTVQAADALPAIYLFNQGHNGGFLVVSADELAMPLLGFSESGHIDPDGTLPQPLTDWLQGYADEIAAARAAAAGSDDAPVIGRPDLTPIAPMALTEWNQNAPYNSLCPVIDGKETFTGCAATAMAQVLKTYEYPAKCSGGTFTFTPNDKVGPISLNFDDITLDWDNMLPTYTTDGSGSTPEQRNAVATLMYALGVASQTSFNTTSSGASTYRMGSGLVRNFGFAPSMQYIKKEWYSPTEWEGIVYRELSQGHAVYCDGTNLNMTRAHAFVIDGGGKNGYFHLNWGWSGLSDGYFLLSALNPSAQGIGGSQNNDGYNFNQGIFTELQPASATDAPAPVLCAASHRITITGQAAYGNAVTISTDAANGGFYNAGFGNTAGAALGLTLSRADGRGITLLATWQLGSYAPYGGIVQRYDVTPRKGMPEGEYVVTPTVRSAAGDHPIRQNFDYGTFTATVDADGITFHTPSVEATAHATGSTVPAETAPEAEVSLSFTIANPTDAAHYHDAVTPALLRSNANNGTFSVVTRFNPAAANIAAGSDMTLTETVQIPADITPGNYFWCLLDSRDRIISETCPVAIAEQTGISHITADADSHAPARYFDLQGRSIASPRPGTICLRRQGTVTTKIIIR